MKSVDLMILGCLHENNYESQLKKKRLDERKGKFCVMDVKNKRNKENYTNVMEDKKTENAERGFFEEYKESKKRRDQKIESPRKQISGFQKTRKKTFSGEYEESFSSTFPSPPGFVLDEEINPFSPVILPLITLFFELFIYSLFSYFNL